VTTLVTRGLVKLFVCGCVFGLALLSPIGCSSSSSGGGRFSRSDGIHELHLFVLPVALKSNPSSSAPDGVAVRIFASSRSRAKGVPIRSGTLEILAYDGALAEPSEPTAKPAQVWSYPAASLPPLATASSLGTGYELALRWTGPRPTNSRLTLVARHTLPTGAALRSAPSIMSNSLK
jgi:hypothetical protein